MEENVIRIGVVGLGRGTAIARELFTIPGTKLVAACDHNPEILEKGYKELSDLAGYEVVGMAYPCGGVNNDDRVAELIRRHTGVKYARTTTTNNCFDLQQNLYRFDPTSYHHDFDSMTRLAEEFIQMKPDKPQIFYIWGHSYEQDFRSDHWVKLEEFFKLISGHDDIFYGTNTEVLL